MEKTTINHKKEKQMSYDYTKGFSEIRNFDTLEKYIDGKEFCHTAYCHYTNLNTIDKILENKCFLLSCCSDSFNDEIDKNQFKKSKMHYGLCFATGMNENLSMWYIYSGFDGKGGRIRFSKAYFKRLIEEAKFELWKCKKENDSYIPETKISDLIPDENIKLVLRDIVYYKNNSTTNTYDLKYNNSHQWNFDALDFEQYKNKYVGFCKGLIWYYEKETRLLAEITGETKRLIDNQGNYKIKLIFSDKVYNNIKIDFAPEITEQLRDIELSKNKNILSFLHHTSNINLSEYQGTIKMNLCKKCQK